MKVKTFSLYEIFLNHKTEMDRAGAVERYIDNKPFMTDDDYAVKDTIISTAKELCKDEWVSIRAYQTPILHSMYWVECHIKLASDKSSQFSASTLAELTVEVVQDRNTRTTILDLLSLCQVYYKVSKMEME